MSKLKEMLGSSYKEGMTPEEIELALESVSLPGDDLKKEVDKLKKALDKSNSEAAESKRKLQEKQTAEEKAKEEQEQKEKALQEELACLRKEKAISDNKAKLMAVGYDDALATDSAQAIVDNDMDKFYANQKTFLEKVQKETTEKLMRGTPTPPAGGKAEMTKEEYRALSLPEKQELATKNPTLYKKFNSEE